MRYGRAEIAVQIDALAEDLLREAIADLQVCGTPEAAAAVLLATAERAGARIVPARAVDDLILPLDLTLGTGPAMVAEVDPASMARLRLEQILPIIADVWSLRQEGQALRRTSAAGHGRGEPKAVDDAMRERYVSLLVTGQRAAAIDEVIALRWQGVPARALAIELIAAAQIEVGRRWQSGAMSIGDEHRATSTSRAALMALTTVSMPAEAAHGTDDPPSIVAACAAGEWHTLPGEIIGHLLAWEGWDVTFLGPSVPADQLAAYLDAHRPTAVALSCSLADRLIGVLGAIDAARAAGVPCLVGGSGFGTDGLRAVRMGAAAWSRDIDGALRVLDRWRAGERPATTEATVDRSAFDLLAVRQETIAAATELVEDGADDDEARARVGGHLGRIFDYAVSAQLVTDPRVLRDCVEWTSRSFPRDSQVLRAGMEAMAEISALAHPAAGELLADAALAVDQRS